VRVTPLLVVAATLASCGADRSESDGDLTVFAAASLTDAFTDIGEAFVATNPGVDVRFNIAGSSDLVAQIAEGAPADVFASADVTNMDRLVDGGGVVGDPVVFATNAAEIIVESGNPLGIAGPADLADDDLVVVQCAPEVPCGSYAERITELAGVAVTPASFEDNVKAVVTKVTLGEADAGIVYRTDVIAAGSAATGVAIPDEFNVVAEYPIAIPAGAPNPNGARAFVEFVLGPEGQEILTGYGFGAP
jgi:molybdate transport system substrate-binding protein